METLLADIIPNFYDELSSLLASFAEFFAGGVVIAFIFWTIGFAVGEVFKLLDSATREGG